MASDSSKLDQPPKEQQQPPWAEETGVWASYDGHCHCGKVRYTFKLSPPLFEEQSEGKGTTTAYVCNCSWCERNGLQLVYAKAENITSTRGPEELSSYSFGNKVVKHCFCKHCGSVVYADASEPFKKAGMEPRFAMNVRMLKDYDPKKLKFKEVGFMKDKPPHYSIDD